MFAEYRVHCCIGTRIMRDMRTKISTSFFHSIYTAFTGKIFESCFTQKPDGLGTKQTWIQVRRAYTEELQHYSSSHVQERHTERMESSGTDRSIENDDVEHLRPLFQSTYLLTSIYILGLTYGIRSHVFECPHAQGASRQRVCGWEKIFDEADDALSVDTLKQIQLDREKDEETDIFSFAIARDPILRFISGYKSKIVCDRVGYSGVDVRDRINMVSYILQSVETNYSKVTLKQAFPFTLPKWLSSDRCDKTEENVKESCCLSFREYVDSILLQMLVRDAINAQNKVEGRTKQLIPTIAIDMHFIPQSELCRYDIFKYDEVHQLEQLNATSFSILNDKIGNYIEAPREGGGAAPPAKTSKRTAIRPKHLHQSITTYEKETTKPTKKELAEAEEILEKLRVFLGFDYANDVIRGLYNFEENREMYIQAVHKVLLIDHKAGLL